MESSREDQGLPLVLLLLLLGRFLLFVLEVSIHYAVKGSNDLVCFLEVAFAEQSISLIDDKEFDTLHLANHTLARAHNLPNSTRRSDHNIRTSQQALLFL